MMIFILKDVHFRMFFFILCLLGRVRIVLRGGDGY